jgi:uncharacterized repeat protein (TIGR01451 family)
VHSSVNEILEGEAIMFHVKPSRPFARQHKHRGQALVEFSLTLMVFLLLLFLIIEVARILQAYITVQHAARLAARYATTGHWEEEYALNPAAGWTPGSDDPLQSIKPCWPAFPSGDPAAATYTSAHYIPTGSPVAPGPDFYEPYRNARTCSIEEVALKGMTGLAPDPTVAPNQPNYYQIIVWGVGNTVDSSETFERGCDPVDVDCPYPQNTSSYGLYYSTDGSGLDGYRGYGGDPQQKVWVRVEYWVQINTPILSEIAPAVRVVGTAIMTNESFGSTGLQREAILPSELPDIPSFAQPTPPDYVVSDITYLGQGSPLDPLDFNWDPDEDASFEFMITNQGTTNTEWFNPLTPEYVLTAYAYPVSALPSLDTPLDTTNAEVLGSWTLSTALIAGQSFTVPVSDVKFGGSVPAGDYAIIAWVDSVPVVNGNVNETGYLSGDELEHNNASRWLGDGVNQDFITLENASILRITDFDFVDAGGTPIVSPDQNDTIFLRVEVTNDGSVDETDVKVQFDAENPLGSLTYLGATPSSGSYDDASRLWDIGGLLPTDVATLEISYQVVAGSGTTISKVGHLFDSLGAEVDNDQDSVIVGATDLVIDKSVDNATPEVGDTITYTFNVINLTSNAATNVRFSDTYPSGALLFDPASVTGAGVTCTETIGGVSTVLSCDLPDVAGSGSVLVTAQYEVISSNEGVPTVNTVTVYTDSPETNTSNNQDSASIDVPTADIEITVDAQDGEGVDAGEEVRFDLTIENLGGSLAEDVYVTLDPDPGLEEGSTAPNPSSGTSYGSLQWDIGTLLPGESRTLSIWFYADPAVAEEGELLELVATAFTSSYEPDIDLDNNEDSDYLVVESEADLSVKQEVDGDLDESINLFDLGQVFDYAIIVSNDGPDDTPDVVVENLGTVLNFSVLTFGAPTVTVTGGTQTPDVDIVGDNLEIEFLQSGQEVRLSYNNVQVSSSPSAPGERIDYELEVSGAASVDPDMTNNTEAHIMMVMPNPFYVNLGDQNNNTCDDILDWGADDPLLGGNVEWLVNQPYGGGNSWGYWGNPRGIRDNEPDVYQHPPPSPYLTADGNRLFGCRARTRFGGQFGYTFDSLTPGLYSVITIYQDTSTSTRFTVEGSGDGGTTWDFLLGSASEGFNVIETVMAKWGLSDPRDARHVYDLERGVLPVIDSGPPDGLGELQVRFRGGDYYNNNGDAEVMGIGYRFFEPLRIDPLPVGFHEDHHPWITYVGTWDFVSDNNATADHYHHSTDSSAQIYFRIDGDGLILYRTLRASNPGDMEVCIDGEASPCAILIDNSAATTTWADPYMITGLGAGVHLIEINNVSPVGGQFELDAVQVLPALNPLGVGWHESNDPDIVYLGDWRYRSHRRATDNHYHFSSDLDASAFFQIDGEGLTIIARTHKNFGRMEVCIDGEASPCSHVFNLRRRPRTWQYPYTITGLGSGIHTIVINNYSPASRPRINIDAIEVLGTPPPLAPGDYEEDADGFLYPGAWETKTNSNATDGHFLRTEDDGAGMTFTFDGTGFSIFRTVRNGTSGTIEVCVDGGSCESIDDGLGSGGWQVQYYRTGLTAGTHTVELTAHIDPGELVEIDAISIFGTPSPLTVGTTQDSDDTNLGYNGSWRGEADGTHYTNDPNATVDFQVTGGTQLVISRMTGPGNGQMEVCVDVTDCYTVDNSVGGVPTLTNYIFPTPLTGATQDVVINHTSAGGEALELDAVTVN